MAETRVKCTLSTSLHYEDVPHALRFFRIGPSSSPGHAEHEESNSEARNQGLSKKKIERLDLLEWPYGVIPCWDAGIEFLLAGSMVSTTAKTTHFYNR